MRKLLLERRYRTCVGVRRMETARPVPLHAAISEFKRKVVLDALAQFSGNRSRAAAALQIERTSLLRLIRELEIGEVVPAPRGRPTGRD